MQRNNCIILFIDLLKYLIKKMHELFSIFSTYDPMISRPIRSILVYLKFMMILVIISFVCMV